MNTWVRFGTSITAFELPNNESLSIAAYPKMISRKLLKQKKHQPLQNGVARPEKTSNRGQGIPDE